MQGAEREQILSTSNGQAQVTHRGERQIIYEAFSNVHAAGIAFREEIRPLTTTPRPLLSQKSPDWSHQTWDFSNVRCQNRVTMCGKIHDYVW